MSNAIEGSRDTNLDYDLIHSRNAFERSLAVAFSRLDGGNPEVADIALGMRPTLTINVDTRTPLDSGWHTLLERFAGELMGGRDDIRVTGLSMAKRYSIISLGLAYSAYDAEWMRVPDFPHGSNPESHAVVEGVWHPESIMDLPGERVIFPTVLLDHDTGLAYISYATPKDFVTRNDDAKPSWEWIRIPPKVMAAYAYLLDQEDVYHMKIGYGDPKMERLLDNLQTAVAATKNVRSSPS